VGLEIFFFAARHFHIADANLILAVETVREERWDSSANFSRLLSPLLSQLLVHFFSVLNKLAD
jgi:hypothetical protein